MIKIDKKVPIPHDANRSGKKYPFADMKVGDSFFAKGMLRKTLHDQANRWSKKYTKWRCKFLVAREKNGYRIWRIK